MPLVRSECLLMTSFTNIKPYNPTANTENAAVRPLLYPHVRVGERKRDGGRAGMEVPIRRMKTGGGRGKESVG